MQALFTRSKDVMQFDQISEEDYNAALRTIEDEYGRAILKGLYEQINSDKEYIVLYLHDDENLLRDYQDNCEFSLIDYIYGKKYGDGSSIAGGEYLRKHASGGKSVELKDGSVLIIYNPDGFTRNRN